MNDQSDLLNHTDHYSDLAVSGQGAAITTPRLTSGIPLGRSFQAPIQKRFGFLTTWNQHCGLATYAKYLLSSFNPGSYVVLAEQTDQQLSARDESYVVRCWKRGSDQFDELEAAIKSYDLGLVHLNCQASFFVQPKFKNWLARLRARGIKLVATIHNPFSLNPSVSELASQLDLCFVHSKENALEMIANGAEPNSVKVVPHGVAVRNSDESVYALRQRLGFAENEKHVVCFGFVQAHKGMEGLIELVSALRAEGHNIRGYLFGKPHDSDPHAKQYLQQLKQIAQGLGVSQFIFFSERFHTDQEVQDYLAASDLALMNYRSQYYEASGACSLAVGAQALVATSIAPPFASFSDAVWHITTGFNLIDSARLLLTNTELAARIRANGSAYATQHSWQEIKKQIQEQYSILGFEATAIGKEVQLSKEIPRVKSVLMQNRPTAFTHRGGDTVLMERTKEGLEKRGVKVSIDLEGREDPAKYDLTHLFNFATPDLTRALAERVVAANKPFVVSTLCEDVPKFHNQSQLLSSALIEYVRRGQDTAWFETNKRAFANVPAAQRFNNDWCVEHAAGLLTNGAAESNVIKRDYPNAAKVFEVKLGYELAGQVGAELFASQYGIKDFILCVGRLESRKNQLMLLKALEHCEIPVVLAAGGFSYQPEYEQAVKNFKRAGPTLVLGRLSDQMLASAYSAAKVHVLPSWYELPGLVSLEAAYHSCNIVATRFGTAQDYFGDHAFYCQPDDQYSILNATLAAYYSPLKQGLKELVMTYRWDKTVEETLKVYEAVIGQLKLPQNEQLSAQPSTHIVYDFDNNATEFQELVERVELEARRKNFKEAESLVLQAESLNPGSARLWRAKGALALAQEQIELAAKSFDRSLEISSNDAKSLVGRGMCDMMHKRYNEAHPFFVKALKSSPNQLIALHQLVECSFATGQFQDLKQALEIYLIAQPDDIEMQYCLAGCRFKLGETAKAKSMAQAILAKNPQHRGAGELLTSIAELENKSAQSNSTISSVASSSTASNSTRNTIAKSTPNINLTQVLNASSPLSAIGRELDRAEELKRQRKLAESLEIAERIVNNAAASVFERESAGCLKAELKVLNGDIQTAEQLYSDLLVSNPTCARAKCGKGAIAGHQGRWLEAEELFKAALEINPRSDVASAGMGLCYSAKGDKEQAWNSFQVAVERNPENMRALLGLIELGYSMNRLQHVESALKVYLERHPVDFNMLYSLAGALYAQTKLKEALEELEKILLFEPHNVKATELKNIIVSKQSKDTNSSIQMAHA